MLLYRRLVPDFKLIGRPARTECENVNSGTGALSWGATARDTVLAQLHDCPFLGAATENPRLVVVDGRCCRSRICLNAR